MEWSPFPFNEGTTYRLCHAMRLQAHMQAVQSEVRTSDRVESSTGQRKAEPGLGLMYQGLLTSNEMAVMFGGSTSTAVAFPLWIQIGCGATHQNTQGPAHG